MPDHNVAESSSGTSFTSPCRFREAPFQCYVRREIGALKARRENLLKLFSTLQQELEIMNAEADTTTTATVNQGGEDLCVLPRQENTAPIETTSSSLTA